jgi:hypothetical protein
MTSALNELMKLVMKNKDIIDNVYFFDEVTEYYVQGVEIRMKNYEVRMNYLDTDDDYHRPDPFRRDIKGYVYLVLGSSKNYHKWYDMMVEGKVSRKILMKYPEILHATFDEAKRPELEVDKELFKKDILSSHPA